MSELREPEFDRAVALVLRVGSFSCFFVMLAGLIDGLFMTGRIPADIERAGVLLMLATPVVRVIVGGPTSPPGSVPGIPTAGPFVTE